MRSQFKSTLVCLVLGFSIGLAAPNIDTSFDVQPDCTQANRDLLNGYVRETLDLVNAAIPGLNNPGSDRVLEEHLETFFGPKMGTIRQRLVTNMLTDVRDFLEGNKIPFRSKVKPRLFCSVDWLEQKQVGDTALDPSGKPLKPNKDGSPRTIRQVYSRNLRGTQVPYYSPLYGTYTIADSEGGSHYCEVNNHKSNLALADEAFEPTALVMCPLAFETVLPSPLVARTDSLGSQQPAEGNSLENFQTRSVTFFHEVIHVVRGTGATTVDTKGKEYYGLKESKGAAINPALARKNPDNYVFFTLGYWFWAVPQPYTRQIGAPDGTPKSEQFRINFASGAAVEETITGS